MSVLGSLKSLIQYMKLWLLGSCCCCSELLRSVVVEIIHRGCFRSSYSFSVRIPCLSVVVISVVAVAAMFLMLFDVILFRVWYLCVHCVFLVLAYNKSKQ